MISSLGFRSIPKSNVLGSFTEQMQQNDPFCCKFPRCAPDFFLFLLSSLIARLPLGANLQQNSSLLFQSQNFAFWRSSPLAFTQLADPFKRRELISSIYTASI